MYHYALFVSFCSWYCHFIAASNPHQYVLLNNQISMTGLFCPHGTFSWYYRICVERSHCLAWWQWQEVAWLRILLFPHGKYWFKLFLSPLTQEYDLNKIIIPTSQCGSPSFLHWMFEYQWNSYGNQLNKFDSLWNPSGNHSFPTPIINHTCSFPPLLWTLWYQEFLWSQKKDFDIEYNETW